MDPELLTVIYACLKIGAVAVPIFSGFGPGAIASRLQDSGARLVFTARTLQRRGKELPLRAKVEEALKSPNSVETLIELCEIPKLLAGQPETLFTLEMASDDLALLLYTSGTTGRPKGCIHTHAGALLQTAKEIYLAFDHKPSDRFFWLSDIGWMMGPWAIFGNHHFRGTIFMYDGAFDYPRPDRLWQTLDEEQITTFGVSPTAIRMLMRGSHPEDYAGDSLRLLGSTGEPWDETSWMWFFKHVGKERCPVINISGGTEILGCFLFPPPIQPLKPCSLGGPAPGMATEVVDEAGRPVRGKKGYLVCTRPSPSMTAGLWGDPPRYLETYWSRFPGWWYHGDWASVDEDGCWFLHGRADESMNVSGRKVGPAELEEILCLHPAVSEAAVIGVPDELKGEEIVAFVVLKNAEMSAKAHPGVLIEHVVKQMGAAFRPKRVYVVADLPKTQSGKIMRRLIRERYLGRESGDVSSLADASVLETFRDLAAEAQ
jgi:acetyl-CoA synthetase